MSQDALQQASLGDGEPGVDPGAGDAVDAIVRQWRLERPELDPTAKQVTGRVVRLGSIFQLAFLSAYDEVGLNGSDFGVMAPLRRAGEPYELTPTDLAKHRMMTSGGMTAAIDRVERKGLVTRVPNPHDRRGSLVRLTPEGVQAIDQAMEIHAETEQRLVASLDAEQQAQLQSLLRTLLLAVEPRD